MQLNPTLESFYLSNLAYAGLRYDEGHIKNINDKIGDITVDGKHLTLPYLDNLRNPEGRHIFHPLNENYTTPETAFVAIYKKRLTLELNLKLSAMVIGILTVAADVHMQNKVKSPKLLSILSEISEIDMTTVENFVSIVKHSQKTNEEGFLVDFHVKKNGHIGETPYAAIGKVNFVIFNELNRALADNEDGYRVFGYKTRKKDVLALINVFAAVFPDIQDKNVYTAGTDMKVFRYFNALLLSSYFVSATVNEVAGLLKAIKEPALGTEEMVSDMGWASTIEEVYNLTTEIRAIPNQTNAKTEGHGLKVKEPASTSHPQASHMTTPVPPSFNPSSIPRSQAPVQSVQATHPPQHTHHPQEQHAQVQTQPDNQTQQPMSAPGPEDIIRNSLQRQAMYQQPMMPQNYPQPMQQGMYPQPMQQGMYPQPMQQGMYPQPMMQQGYPQQMQQGYPQPMMQQGYPQQMQQPMYPQQMQQPMQQGMSPEQVLRNMGGGGGIPLNPQILNNSVY